MGGCDWKNPLRSCVNPLCRSVATGTGWDAATPAASTNAAGPRRCALRWRRALLFDCGPLEESRRQSYKRLIHAARTRLKNAATSNSRSSAREDTRRVKSAISSKAVTLRLAACSTDRISAEALAVVRRRADVDVDENASAGFKLNERHVAVVNAEVYRFHHLF